MAQVFLCDGCGKKVDNPKKVGYVIQREYCDECEPKAKAFLDGEEVLRNAVHEQFKSARTTLIRTSGGDDKKFKLPDVP